MVTGQRAGDTCSGTRTPAADQAMCDGAAPDTTRVPRASGLAGRILAALAAGATHAPTLRTLLGGNGNHQFHQRLSELIDLGWVERHVLLTEAGRQAVARMNAKKDAT